MNNKRGMATQAALAPRQRSRGGIASGQTRTEGWKTPIAASQAHRGCTSPRQPDRRAPGHHGAVPAPPHSKQPQLQPWSHQLCNPWGSKTPKKQTPPCTGAPASSSPPRQQRPGQFSALSGGNRHQLNSRDTSDATGTGGSRPAAAGMGAQGHAPPATLRHLGHPNLHPGGIALLLPHKAEITAPTGAPASLPMPGHPTAPCGAELIHHLKAQKLPAAGGRRRQLQLSRLLLIKRKRG